MNTSCILFRFENVVTVDFLVYICKNQSWFRVKIEVSEFKKSTLKSADSELILSETALNILGFNTAVSEKVRADQL